MITLTLKADWQPLRDRVTRLYASFARLQRRELWRSNITAAAAFCEVKKNERTGSWHPHMHILAIGKFIPKTLLSTEWHRVTGDSYIVDIRSTNDQQRVAQYVTKYLTKPTTNDVYRDQDDLKTCIEALHNRRMVATYGAWRGVSLLAKADDDDWTPIMPWPELLKRCRIGDPEALTIYEQLSKRQYVCETPAWPNELDPIPPPLPSINDAKAQARGYANWIDLTNAIVR